MAGPAVCPVAHLSEDSVQHCRTCLALLSVLWPTCQRTACSTVVPGWPCCLCCSPPVRGQRAALSYVAGPAVCAVAHLSEDSVQHCRTCLALLSVLWPTCQRTACSTVVRGWPCCLSCSPPASVRGQRAALSYLSCPAVCAVAHLSEDSVQHCRTWLALLSVAHLSEDSVQHCRTCLALLSVL